MRGCRCTSPPSSRLCLSAFGSLLSILPVLLPWDDGLRHLSLRASGGADVRGKEKRRRRSPSSSGGSGSSGGSSSSGSG